MNVFFVGFYGDDGCRVVREACRACSISEFTLIGDEEVLVSGVQSTFLDKGYFRNAKINIHDVKDRKAVDAQLCEQLRETEVEFYQQCERLNRKYEFSSFISRREFYLRSLIYLNDLIERSGFDRIVMSNVPHLGYDTLIYGLAKIKNIPVQFFYRLPIITDKFFYLYSECDLKNHRLADMTEFLEEFDRIPTEEKEAEKLLLETPLEAWEEIVCRKPRSNAAVGRQNKNGMVKGALMRLLAMGFSSWRFMPYKNALEIGHILAPERPWLDKNDRKVRGAKLVRYYDSIARRPDPSRKYVYFPLHKQPEATTSPLGGVYQDQKLAIRLLSQELPEGWKIYVKEFPHQKESHRSKAFYEELISLGSVELIRREVDSLGLVAGAEFTATVTGTAAWESFCMGKPAVLFGYSILAAAKGVFDVKSEADLRNALAEIGQGLSIDHNDKLAFFYALDKVCFRGYLEPYKPAVKDLKFSREENAAGIVKEIAGFLGGTL